MIKKNSNTHNSRTRSKCETKNRNSIWDKVCFWSVWFFNHTHGHFFGIGVSTKRLIGVGNLYSTHQTTWSNRNEN